LRQNFDRAFDLVVGSEGAYDTDPDDRGNWTSGIVGVGQLNGTKYGIAAHVYPYLDIKRLTLDKAKEIYLRDYWGERCDGLKSGVDYVYFDMCVNNGKAAANKLLQRALGIRADGIWGPQTEGAVTAADPVKVINALSAVRNSYYHSLRMFWKYGRGWLNRVARVRNDAIKMTREN
jgi:lysozyme family protein